MNVWLMLKALSATLVLAAPAGELSQFELEAGGEVTLTLAQPTGVHCQMPQAEVCEVRFGQAIAGKPWTYQIWSGTHLLFSHGLIDPVIKEYGDFVQLGLCAEGAHTVCVTRPRQTPHEEVYDVVAHPQKFPPARAILFTDIKPAVVRQKLEALRGVGACL